MGEKPQRNASPKLVPVNYRPLLATTAQAN